MGLLPSPFLRWGNGGSERLRGLLQSLSWDFSQGRQSCSRAPLARLLLTMLSCLAIVKNNNNKKNGYDHLSATYYMPDFTYVLPFGHYLYPKT